MERKLAWARLLAWWPAASSVACNARSSGSQSVAGPIRRVMKMILPIALLTCLDGLEPIQSHQNVACDTALVSTILQRTAFDLPCRPPDLELVRTIWRTFSMSTLHDAERMAASSTIASTTTRDSSMRRVPDWSPSLARRASDGSRSCQSDGSFVRKLHFASRSRRRVPSRWPVEKGQHARFHACRVRP